MTSESEQSVWGIPARLLAAGSSMIEYELISENYGISEDGIEIIVDWLQRMLSGQDITNGHVLAYFLTLAGMF